MHDPQSRHTEREGQGGLTAGFPLARQQQGAPDEAEKGQPRQGVNHEVEQVVPARIQSAEGVVHRQRQVDERPPGGARGGLGRGQRVAQRPEMTDRQVPLDRRRVIEEERHGQAVRIGGQDGQH